MVRSPKEFLCRYWSAIILPILFFPYTILIPFLTPLQHPFSPTLIDYNPFEHPLTIRSFSWLQLIANRNSHVSNFILSFFLLFFLSFFLSLFLSFPFSFFLSFVPPGKAFGDERAVDQRGKLLRRVTIKNAGRVIVKEPSVAMDAADVY